MPNNTFNNRDDIMPGCNIAEKINLTKSNGQKPVDPLSTNIVDKPNESSCISNIIERREEYMHNSDIRKCIDIFIESAIEENNKLDYPKTRFNALIWDMNSSYFLGKYTSNLKIPFTSSETFIDNFNEYMRIAKKTLINDYKKRGIKLRLIKIPFSLDKEHFVISFYNKCIGNTDTSEYLETIDNIIHDRQHNGLAIRRIHTFIDNIINDNLNKFIPDKKIMASAYDYSSAIMSGDHRNYDISDIPDFQEDESSLNPYTIIAKRFRAEDDLRIEFELYLSHQLKNDYYYYANKGIYIRYEKSDYAYSNLVIQFKPRLIDKLRLLLHNKKE